MINHQQLTNLLMGRKPKTAIILGSGLGDFANHIDNPLVIQYSKIEGFPQSTVAGHQGRMIIGKIANKEVLCLQGRFHLYEGYSPQIICEVIKTLKIIGIEQLIVTNAAGSTNYDMPAGSLMLIKDHINLSGTNPLIGPNDDTIGPRFPDMSNAYDNDLRDKIKQLAQKLNIKLFEGTYLMVSGPTFDTPAEIVAYRILGADAIGMSTVPEVIAAVHAGIKVIGFSAISNLGAGMRKEALSHSETLDGAAKTAQSLKDLIINYCKESKNV